MGAGENGKRIELFVGCRSIGECSEKALNCFAVLMRQEDDDNDFEELGRTETVCNSGSPQFCTSFEVVYEEEKAAETLVRVEVYERLTEATERLKDHEYLGKATFSIDGIMSAEGNHLTTQLSHPTEEKKVGILTVSAEDIDTGNEENSSEVQLDILAAILRKRDWNKTLLSQRYELRRAHRHEDADGHTVWLPIYKSDRIAKQRDNNLMIEFSSASLKYRHLCNGDDERRIRISIFALPQTAKRTAPETFIGMACFSLRDICEIDPTEEVLQLERASDEVEDIGHLSIVKAEPTDFGSHFSLQVNHENTTKYMSVASEDKVVKRKGRLSMSQRLSITKRDMSAGAKVMSEIKSSVDSLFSGSFTGRNSHLEKEV